MKEITILILFVFYILLAGCSQKNELHSSGVKPNIIIILADDMGYSDIGCFGSEISTPNLDKLAEDGLRMTHFYNAARCCPSRASILTGLYPHQAGMGSMADQEITLPSYAGYLTPNSVTIAEVLNEAGYDTYTSGKWHVGEEKTHWPIQRGFDHCFSFIHGATSYYDNEPYRNSEWPWSDGEVFTVLDNEKYTYPDTPVYSTDLYTDYAIRFVNESNKTSNPFFLYLAYTAPHWPLHAPEEDVQKYIGKYMQGWDSIRHQRYRKQLQMGIHQKEYELSPAADKNENWQNLTEQQKIDYDRKMAVYAAMIDRMDQNIGRLLKQLEINEQLDNTVIMFISDNGGCSAGNIPYLHERFDPEAPVGSPNSFTGYGKQWANVSNTPFRQYKAQVHEGGIASPFVAWNPKYIGQGTINHTRAHIFDLMNTCIALAGADYPDNFHDNKITPSPGVDLTPLFKGEKISRMAPIIFEHFENEAIFKDSMKMVKLNSGPWELYHIENDRTELNDLMESTEPELIKDMVSNYNQIKDEIGVFPQSIVKKRTIIKKK